MSDVGPFSRGTSDLPADGATGETDLGEREQRILAFERQWWKFEGSKEQAIRDEFGFSPTRYYQLLNGLIDRPEALAHDPMTVKRIRRLRADRRRQRTARMLGIQL
ncbi:DUF3263 domain-containing protein [Marinactinospora thermotolerans]|uniref:DUF3263 domain-containing protein n=1 Tax=Marinactinospora thermotolerans DSM 45154 TaxID=1122192 RepID=A0A1T4MY29_9ACTN|nr:DUF3263 domain-containing protein [Marinactinospora thermotolerans]SJZ71969.1 Protein of unknown function [Marinactinospora thermotolerans DSM 45154]